MGRIPRTKRMALVSQSTQPPWKFQKLAAFMVSRAHELKIVNTVCPVTIRRQEDTIELAEQVDMMVVVGGRNSANTRELTRLVGIAGKPAVQVERAAELTDASIFEGYRVVGITGGTSTPIEDLETVTRRVCELAGTPDVQAQARELASAAIADVADPAYRSTSIGRPRRGVPARDAPAGRRRRGLSGRPRRIERAHRREPREPAPRRPAARGHRRPSQRGQVHAVQSHGRRPSWPSWRIAHAPRVTGCTPRRSGTAGGSWSSTPVASSGARAIPSRRRSRTRRGWPSREADVILFVVDAASGLTPSDDEAAALLRRAKVPVIVVANKADNEKRELEAAEAYGMGWEETYAVSAQHGRGTGDLLDAIVWALPPESESEIERKRREEEIEELAELEAEGLRRAVRRGRVGEERRGAS